MDAHKLSDSALCNSLKNYVEQERAGTLGVVQHLAELESRNLHLALGYGSLFSYLVVELGYSESAAMRRIAAARTIRKVPEVFVMLKRGLLNLSTISQIAPILNEQNKFELLKRVAGQSKRKVEEILCEYRAPQETDFEDRFDPYLLALRNKCAAEQFQGMSEQGFENYLRRGGKVFEKRYRIQFSAKPQTVEKLERVKKLLSGKFPRGASTEEALETILDEYISRHCPFEKAKRSVVRDRAASKTNEAMELSEHDMNHRYIPSNIRLEVLMRDGFRCTYIGKDGRRCESCWDLELDHHPVPFARGGSSTVGNLRTLCSSHNQFSATVLYGRKFMRERQSSQGQKPCSLNDSYS